MNVAENLHTSGRECGSDRTGRVPKELRVLRCWAVRHPHIVAVPPRHRVEHAIAALVVKHDLATRVTPRRTSRRMSGARSAESCGNTAASRSDSADDSRVSVSTLARVGSLLGHAEAGVYRVRSWKSRVGDPSPHTTACTCSGTRAAGTAVGANRSAPCTSVHMVRNAVGG